MDQTQPLDYSYLTTTLCCCCLYLLPYATHLPCPCVFLTAFLSLPFLSLVILCFASCLHTHKMEGSSEVPIQNSFVVLPAPYPLSSCRGDPGEPYHSSICKCPCTWATAWACWDWELIYANLRETVTAQHRAGHRHWWPYLPASTTTSWEKTWKTWKMRTKCQRGERGVRVKEIEEM